MVYIYILKLQSNKYYIGKTDIPNFKFKDFFKFEEIEWTVKYKPIKLVKLISDCDDFDIYKSTLKYMAEYGIDNVRGGSFTKVKLEDGEIKIIQKMLYNKERDIIKSNDVKLDAVGLGEITYNKIRKISVNTKEEIEHNIENNTVTKTELIELDKFIFNSLLIRELAEEVREKLYNDSWANGNKYKFIGSYLTNERRIKDKEAVENLYKYYGDIISRNEKV